MEKTLESTARQAMESIANMVAALNCDYDRLEELREKREESGWIAGWNMPGYMPDSEPARFDTQEEGKQYLIEEILRYADGIEDETKAEEFTAIAEDINLESGEIGVYCGDYFFLLNDYSMPEDEIEELEMLENDAGDCESQDEAIGVIMEDALSLEFRSGWDTDRNSLVASEFKLLLKCGGPHVEIRGEIENGEPSNPRLLVADWGQGLTEYFQADRDVLLQYCQCFYFGE